TSAAVWRALAPARRLDPFLPRFTLDPEEHAALRLVVQQALVVVLDTVVRAGRRRRSLTLNDLFDAVAPQWSDHSRLAREEQRAQWVRDMTRNTAVACRRDLLRVGIRLDALWRVAASPTPLYVLHRTLERRPGLTRTLYRVRLIDGQALDEFEALVHNDPSYEPREERKRVLFDADPMPAWTPRREVCAEHPYNVVELGPRSHALLATMGQSRLLFN